MTSQHNHIDPNASHDVNSTPKKGTRSEEIRNILSTVAVVLIAPILALLLSAFVFQSYQVDGPSMETTLNNNDRLIVWKTPRTWARITHHQYIPERGDVIVFSDPDIGDFGQNPNKQLIKRVIGLPGERVVVKDGKVTVFNKEHPQGFEPDATLPYGDVIINTVGNREDTIPAGHVYVMGDNRDNSLDSRSFGPVDANNIVGKLVLRVLPASDMKRF